MPDASEESKEPGPEAVTSVERISTADLIGMCKYVYVRPSLLAKAKERFGDDAIVTADWRLDVENRDWYVSSCPIAVPKQCTADDCCFAPDGHMPADEHLYLVNAE